jgi:hypothetical protein
MKIFPRAVEGGHQLRASTQNRRIESVISVTEFAIGLHKSYFGDHLAYSAVKRLQPPSMSLFNFEQKIFIFPANNINLHQLSPHSRSPVGAPIINDAPFSSNTLPNHQSSPTIINEFFVVRGAANSPETLRHVRNQIAISPRASNHSFIPQISSSIYSLELS